MPRVTPKADDLDTITARRTALIAELAAVDEKLKAAELAARDAGRPILLAALDKVKIASLDKADARIIATAIGQHGGALVAAHLGTMTTS